jgi:alpha-beta hydrolase superfamily lysophospholipase
MKAVAAAALALLALLGAGALVYAAALALLWFQQERLIFLPTPLAPEHRFDVGPDVHEAWVDVPGARLHALHLRLPRPAGVVFYLHGNAGNLRGWFANAEFYRRANMDLFMLDYRGYGKSSGHIDSEQQLHADVRAAWRQIASLYEGRRRVILGRSLGSGPALVLAAELRPELTLLVSPYESFAALAAQYYGWVPSALLRYPMRSDLAIARVSTPIVLIHGERDEVIPAAHSRRLQTLAPHARLHIIPGAGHNDLHEFAAYLEAVARALQGP